MERAERRLWARLDDWYDLAYFLFTVNLVTLESEGVDEAEEESESDSEPEEERREIFDLEDIL